MAGDKAQTRRLSLILHMDNPVQRGAWEKLSALPRGQRTEYICRAVCKERVLLDDIRAAVREAMTECGGSFSAQKSEPTEPNDSFDNAALDFLRELQREED